MRMLEHIGFHVGTHRFPLWKPLVSPKEPISFPVGTQRFPTGYPIVAVKGVGEEVNDSLANQCDSIGRDAFLTTGEAKFLGSCCLDGDGIDIAADDLCHTFLQMVASIFTRW